MKRYTELTKQEKIALSNDGFYDAVKLEAIQRGISPPITLSEALRTLEFRGFNIPPDAVSFYEISIPEEYSNTKETGIAFRTNEEAKRALQGAVCIGRDYGGSNPKIKNANFSIRETFVTLVSPRCFGAELESFKQDAKPFEALADELSKDWSAVLQEDYNARVNAEKKVQYLALAQGNEEIAKAFWAKAERSEWGQSPDAPLPVTPVFSSTAASEEDESAF